MTLVKETRDAIGRTVRSLRVLFEDEFGKQASGRFGIRSTARGDVDGDGRLDAWLDPTESLSLTPAEFAQRDELVHALRYLTSEGNEPGEAVARLIREAAFTAVNRLLAVRVAEAIGALPEVLSAGRQSAGYRDTVGDLFPGLAHDEDSYWIYVQVAGDELAPGVPRLFDRRHPTSAFVPSRACVDEALELLTVDELDEAWAEPETLGWGYQFFNGDDVKRMRDASSAPRTSRELAVRNQFFTPRYVVDWLVENTLGRRLVQAGYKLELPLLVGDVGEHEPLMLEDVRVLDPAVGSGHFLLGSYDLLEQAWQTTGVPPSDAAAKILPCLFGVDIDARAAQVAQAVILLRARRSAPTGQLTAPTVVTAVALPHSKALREQAFGELSPAARNLADEVTDTLDQAPLLGSLLKVEQRIEQELVSHKTAPRLAADGDEAHVLNELHHALDELVSTAASPEQRMFTADATDALRFLDICQQRYDTVLMNPPFGDAIPDTKVYLKAAYGPYATDLHAAFVARGVGMLRAGGFIGAITSRSGFFLTSFREWRERVVIPRLHGMLDLGIGVMHDAMVRAATYVLSDRVHDGSATFYRFVDEPNKQRAVTRLQDSEPFVRRPEDFRSIPESPAAYWLAPRLLELFKNRPSLEDSACEVRVGLQTSDNFRFVRLWWEVPAQAIGKGRRWIPFATGGGFSPYYADLHTVVEWEDGGRRLQEWGKGRVQNTDYYFRPGLTWNRRSEGFFVALVPSGAIFSNNGQMVFVDNDDPEEIFRLMAYLNSATAGALIEPMVGAEQYEVGMVGRIPFVNPGDAAGESARRLVEAERFASAARNETNHFYVSPWAAHDPEQDSVSLAQDVDAAVLCEVGEDAPVRPLSATVATDWFNVRALAPTADVEGELSYLVGASFGRWDIRFTREPQRLDPLPDPLAPLPATGAGMLLTEDGLPAHQAPSGYPIVIPPDRLLHDDPGHPRDIIAAIQGVVGALHEGANAPRTQLSSIRNLRKHVRHKFFAGHLKRYSASRRYAPIYWQLAVPSKRWGLWLYAPPMSRESLFAIDRAAREKLSSINDQISLGEERAVNDRSARERFEALEDLAAEVEKFATIADEVAQSGWKPDPNDGFVLNAAPLEELFVDNKWLKQIAKHRKSMQNGEYPWATVQREYFEKRV